MHMNVPTVVIIGVVFNRSDCHCVYYVMDCQRLD